MAVIGRIAVGPVRLQADHIGNRGHAGGQVWVDLHPELGIGDYPAGHDTQAVGVDPAPRVRPAGAGRVDCSGVGRQHLL